MFQKVMLVSIAILGFTQVPMYGQQTTVQSGTQEANVSGSGNTVHQTINNTVIHHPGLGLQKREQNQNSSQPANVRHSSERSNRGHQYGHRNRDEK